ncbi:hypothetical protein BDF14DRAFT_1839177 [Spinellus fusiger]|nr:hypothetical protein BDF14DRAFT_1839177 [Spinellus fusiger]
MSVYQSKKSNPVHAIQIALAQSFQLMCSKEQLDMCQSYGILTKSEQQEMKSCAKTWRTTPISLHPWNETIACLITLRDKYQARLDALHVRPLASDYDRTELLEYVQVLSQQLDQCGQTHEELEKLCQALRHLENDWKRSKIDIENIVHSILSSVPLQASECRVVKATRSNIHFLGLGYGSLGKHYLVFESSKTSLDQCKDIIMKITHDFGYIFQENAAQNLASMQGNYHHIFAENQDMQEHQQVMQNIQSLIQRLFTPPSSFSFSSASSSSSFSSIHSHQQTSTLVSSFTDPLTLAKHSSPSFSSLPSLSPSHSPFSSSSASPLFVMACPIFEPASWDWPRLLKNKQPARHTSWARSFFRHTFARSSHSTVNTKAPLSSFGLWTCSISRLSDHLAKVGQEYYINLLNNARLMHSHQTQLFETASRHLIQCHQALQIEHAHANIVWTLAQMDHLQRHFEMVKEQGD